MYQLFVKNSIEKGYTIAMITIKAVHAKTFWQKTIGLIGKNTLQPLFLQTHWGIHTFGMRQSLDIIIFRKNTVVVFKENLKPNRIYLWNPKYQDVLELPPGSIQKLHIQKGTIISIQL